MPRTLPSIVMAAAVAVGCGGVEAPTAPTPVTPTPESSARAGGPEISALEVTSQMVDGRFTYWPRLVIAAGSAAITVERIELRSPESRQAGPFSTSHFSMYQTVGPGRTFTFEREFASTVAVSQVTAVVAFTDGAGLVGQLAASAVVPPVVPGPPSSTLHIDGFTVTEFMAGSHYAYWPKLTLAASAGAGAVTVTRLQFVIAGADGLPQRGPWRVPAGTTVQLFHREFYGEPEFHIPSPMMVDEVSVLVSYVDDSGRSADVRAVAQVAR